MNFSFPKQSFFTIFTSILEKARDELANEITEILSMNEQLGSQIKVLQSQLVNNDQQNLITNLERRWANNQQNNQVLIFFDR